MRYSLLLLVPVLPLAVIAAPVPRDAGRAEFGTNGLLTRADLEKVKFDTRAVKRDDGRDFPEDNAEDRQEEGPKRLKPGGPANRYDLAVHMPWTTFREGEPVPAYFVLRNNGNRLYLGSRMDLSGTYPELHGGGMSFDVRDRATGKSVLKGLSASTNCGGGALTEVPPEGFYCAKGDLARFTEGLAPGEYEVDWRCGRLVSAPVKFTVTKTDGAKPAAPAKPTRARFFHLTHEPYCDEWPERTGEPFVRDGRVASVHPPALAAALAVGQHDVYVPDVQTIPVADKFVEAWVRLKPYREEDRVVVTLRALAPHKQVRFEELPQLFLQVETPDRGDRGWGELEAAEKLRDRKRGHDELLVTPLTIEVALPKQWRERVGPGGAARVAVLVAAKEIELPLGRGERKMMMRAEVARAHFDDERPLWGGIVRTEFVELSLPARLSGDPGGVAR